MSRSSANGRIARGKGVGQFISFEGVDGCGKSTQLGLLADWLGQQGQTVCTTFEPGDTALGRHLRELLMHGAAPVPEAELFLFLADRAEHVAEVIRPALERGDWVLCDRYTDSTRAYQLAGRALAGDLGPLLAAAEVDVRPACTVWLDLPVEQALARMANRAAAGGRATRMDEESLAFHRRVQAGFASICQQEPERVLRVAADADIETVQRRIRQGLAERLGPAWPR
jgi:dTMP kinase